MGAGKTGEIVSATGFCAALYAIGSYLTCYLVSPFGRGQFRPAVVLPAIFSIIYGPEAGGLGAAIGTVIADSAKHGALYLPSLLAAAPGNFIGFYIFGKLTRKNFNWRRFSIASQLSLWIGCATVAYLYTLVISLLRMLPPSLTPEDLFMLGTSLTLWFFITEYPFVILLVPPILRVLAPILGLKLQADLRRGPSWLISLTIPGIILLAISLIITFTPASSEVMKGLLVKLSPSYASSTLQLIQLLFTGSGAAMVVIGLLLQIRGA